VEWSRSRVDRKHDLDTDEICPENVGDESKITLRIRAESVGVIVRWEGMRRVGSEILDNRLARPISTNSVLN